MDGASPLERLLKRDRVITIAGLAALFVGGVMNLVWIAALAILVLVEKLLPAGRWIGRAAGIVLIAWGGATLLM